MSVRGRVCDRVIYYVSGYMLGVEYERSCICVLGVEYERSCICVLGVEYERSCICVLGVEYERHVYVC